MIGQGLELKQQQKLSPMQIQTIKLLELPVQELEQRIRAEMEENPVLEEEPETREDAEDKDISLDELREDDYIPAYKTRVSNWGRDERPEYNTFSVRESFTQSLLGQLGFRDLSEHERAVASFIIGSLDDDGYLRRSVSTVVDDLAFKAGIESDEREVERMLGIIQEFEPSGVGARDLQECLLIQLRCLDQTQDVRDSIRIIGEEFQEFSNKHYSKIMSRLGLSEDALRAAIARIVRLNPTPGAQVDDSYSEQAQQIVPDFVLTEADGRLGFEMPRFKVPELRINRKYAEMLMDAKDSTERERKEAATFVRQKIDSAKWLIEAVRQRQNTLSKTMQAILDFQYNFFQTGDDTLIRPMILEDIATVAGFDISTISRVVNSKYIETPYGIYPLKYFFSESMKNSAGEDISTRELKKALLDCIEAEDKHRPLTDEELVEALSSSGYVVARRTIAKYRDQLGIPIARLRKKL